jgi:hypothetical protein
MWSKWQKSPNIDAATVSWLASPVDDFTKVKVGTNSFADFEFGNDICTLYASVPVPLN